MKHDYSMRKRKQEEIFGKQDEGQHVKTVTWIEFKVILHNLKKTLK